MSIRNALVKLCACATGGALFGGGAVHVGDVTPKKATHLTAVASAQQVAPRVRSAVTSGRSQKVVRRLRRVHTKTVTTVAYAPQAIQIAGFVPPAGPAAGSTSQQTQSGNAVQSRGGGYVGGGYFGGWGGGGGSVVLVSANASATSSASSSSSSSSSSTSSSNVTPPPPGGHEDHHGPGRGPGGGGGDGGHPPPGGGVDVPAPPVFWLFGLSCFGLLWGNSLRRRARKLS